MDNLQEIGYDILDCNGNKVYLDFAVTTANGRLLCASFYERSAETVKSVGASLMLRHGCTLKNSTSGRQQYVSSLYRKEAEYKGFQTFLGGTDRFTNMLVLLNIEKAQLVVCEKGGEADALYNYLMNTQELPLLREWAPELLTELTRKGIVQYFDGSSDGKVCVYGQSFESLEREIPLNGKQVKLMNMRVFALADDEQTKQQLPAIVTRLIKDGKIAVCKVPQKHFDFESMDDYMKVHGSSLVENLAKKIKPLTELNGNAETFTTKARPLYPQQIAMVNGVTALSNGVGKNRKERKKSSANYAFLNEGMGCGKTLQAAAMCEALAVEKEVRKGRTLDQIYDPEDNSINYRVVIMCPGHLRYKWAREIENDVPYSKVTVIEDFAQLVKLREAGAERHGREFFVMSKDFAKLDCEEQPAVTSQKYGYVMKRDCVKCGRRDVKTPQCLCGNESKWKLTPTREKVYGMVCPSCGNVLIPYKRIQWGVSGLKAGEFADKRDTNSTCMYCGSSLWMPRVKNLRIPGQEPKKPWWSKMTFWSNEAHKNKETLWVHRRSYDLVSKDAINIIEREGVRKTAPANYIKRHMKNYFDIAIFDEVHTLKSGDSAQGAAMHALCKASKKQLALTGTIAGGYADHLFYLLWRLDSRRMKDAGYTWESLLKFIEKYGSLETTYDGEVRMNKMSKGRQTSQPKCKPGISPRIFTDFLLDRTVFLDVTDLSKYLPPLKEKVVLVDLDDKVFNEYGAIIKNLQTYGRNHGIGMRLMATTLQMSLSYPDKPFGRLPVLNPQDGEKILVPQDFEEYADGKKLLPKEAKLIELLKEELAEGRNCFIYAEYTGVEETRISERLKDILERELELTKDQVAILDSKKVEAGKREEWIAKTAKKGARIIITNPKCVETGLDFCFTVDGKTYNYPTIFFFQMGYSLFTIWQASRRHYRLNQRQECRTYYMGYKGTAQEALIGLVAKKMQATSAIQGKFSSEGLSAMAHGVDARVALAQAMSNMDFSTSNDLQDMFDVVKAETDTRFAGVQRMKVLSEIVKSVSVSTTEDFNIFDEDIFSGNEKPEPKVEAKKTETFDDFFEYINQCFENVGKPATNTSSEPSATAEPTVIKKKKKSKISIQNQAFFF